MSSIVVLLEAPPPFYSPGQVVSGRVILTLVEPEDNIKALFIHCTGNAHVEWQTDEHVHHGSHSDLVTHYHTNHNTFLDNKIVLSRTKDGILVKSHLPRGRHEFPFFFTLPPGIPSTFNGFGGINYSCEAKLERSGLFSSDLKASIPIPVWRLKDLNESPEAKFPKEIHNEKYICCCCCEDGPLGYTLRFPKTGFLPGEQVKFHLHMYNKSSTRIDRVKVALYHVEVWVAYGGVTRSTTLDIKTTYLQGLDGGQEVNEMMAMDLIPSTYRPLSLVGCSFAHLTYEFSIEMIIPGSFNLSSTLPIAIGSIPFLQIQRPGSAHPPIQTQPYSKSQTNIVSESSLRSNI